MLHLTRRRNQSRNPGKLLELNERWRTFARKIQRGKWAIRKASRMKHSRTKPEEEGEYEENYEDGRPPAVDGSPNFRCQVANARITALPPIHDDTCIGDIATDIADVMLCTTAELTPGVFVLFANAILLFSGVTFHCIVSFSSSCFCSIHGSSSNLFSICKQAKAMHAPRQPHTLS